LPLPGDGFRLPGSGRSRATGSFGSIES